MPFRCSSIPGELLTYLKAIMLQESSSYGLLQNVSILCRGMGYMWPCWLRTTAPPTPEILDPAPLSFQRPKSRVFDVVCEGVF